MSSNSQQSFFASQYGSLCRSLFFDREQKHRRHLAVDLADTLQYKQSKQDLFFIFQPPISMSN
jgi:hypothetical protein